MICHDLYYVFMTESRIRTRHRAEIMMAPRAGFEPTTFRLTAMRLQILNAFSSVAYPVNHSIGCPSTGLHGRQIRFPERISVVPVTVLQPKGPNSRKPYLTLMASFRNFRSHPYCTSTRSFCFFRTRLLAQRAALARSSPEEIRKRIVPGHVRLRPV